MKIKTILDLTISKRRQFRDKSSVIILPTSFMETLVHELNALDNGILIKDYTVTQKRVQFAYDGFTIVSVVGLPGSDDFEQIVIDSLTQNRLARGVHDRLCKYPFNALNVGETFFVAFDENTKTRNLAASICSAGRRCDLAVKQKAKFRIKTERNVGIEVRRVL